MKKRWNFLSVSPDAVKDLQKALNIDPILCQLLVQRGITTYDEAKLFFRPQLQHLHDPFLMKNMSKAVARLEQAIEQGQNILLYGDYDVDGTCSVALMYTFLKTYHQKLNYYIPDRYKEGYGISFDGIEYAKANNIDLIIAMDCGVKAHQQIELANKYNIDVIVCDHHLPSQTLPDAYAMLNPKQADCPYPYKELTGCGIAFKLAQAYQSKIAIDWDELANLLDILVVSIGCDIVPITDENRVMAYYGLKKLNTKARIGLKALMEVGQQSVPMSVRDVVFGLGPSINAAGRLGDAKLAVRLMLAKTPKEAKELSMILHQQNQERKKIEAQTVAEAKIQFENLSGYKEQKSVVLYQEDWHKGVVGIVAARMVDQYYHPSIVLTKSGDKVVGSARSVRGFDVHQAIGKCSDLLLGYGGHQHAAGLTMEEKNVTLFRERFEEVVRESRLENTYEPEINVSSELEFIQITDSFWRILKQFAPFGPGNRNPIFVSKKVKSTTKTRIVKEKHLKIGAIQNATEFSGIGFGLGNYYNNIIDNEFDICYNLNENTWRNQTKLQLNLKGIAVSSDTA